MNEDSLQNLLKQVSLINSKYEDIAKITGENFNIFNILGVRSDEVKHSKFLAELLNPKGSHDQGDVFLKLFVDMLRSTLKDTENNNVKIEIDCSSAHVVKEKSVGKIDANYTEGGRIDILINDKKNTIVIENKIYADDQEYQLGRYKKAYPNATIIYLTLEGSPPSNDVKELKEQVDFHLLSYKTDIISWLEECKLKSASFPILRETIVQYINIIKNLTNQLNSNNMSIEVSNTILSSEQNFKAAKSVIDGFQSAKNDLLNKFWDEVLVSLLQIFSFHMPPCFTKKKDVLHIPTQRDQNKGAIFTVEPLNGKHWKDDYNKLFISIYSDHIDKQLDNYGPNNKFKSTKKLEYDFDDYSTLQKILPGTTTRKEVVEEITNEISAFINNRDNIHLLYGTKLEVIDKILDLRNKVAHATGNQKWWNWRGEILVFWDFIYDSKKIGIESKFTEVDNTFSSFEIKITTWDVEALKFYKEDLKKYFPDNSIIEVEGRGYLHIGSFDSNDEKGIISKLKECYDILSIIIAKKISK